MPFWKAAVCSVLVVVGLKRLFSVGEDEEQSRDNPKTDRSQSIPNQSYSVPNGVLRTTALLTSQRNFGAKTNSSRAHNESYPSQTKSTYINNGETMDKKLVPVKPSIDDVVKSRARDAVSDAYASKQSPNPNREKIANSSAPIKLSGNQIVKSIDSSPVTGNNKDSSVTSQVALASSCSPKPSSVASEPSLSSISVKPSEISQKVKRSSSSSIHRGEDAKKCSNSINDDRHSYGFPPVTSDQLQSSTRFPVSSDCFNSSPSTVETGMFHSAQKTNQPEKSQSPKPPPLSIKPTISLVPPSSLSRQKKTTYVWVERDASSTYVFPKEIKNLIEKDIVPGVLSMPLSKSSYKDYFHALLYAEDCYLEKWDGFEMKNVKVQLHEAAIYSGRGRPRNLNIYDDKDEKVFVAFELDEIRERRPFLKSRDFVSLQPSNCKSKTFQGVIYRVVKSNLVLAEFGEDFCSHHHPDDKYDVKFSFNRVCLKRAHQAIAAASDSLFRNLLFPDAAPKHELPSTQFFAKNNNELEAFAIQQILRLQGAPPYLVAGPLVVAKNQLSKTGVVIVEAILRIFRADPSKKILVCAPVNNTCDMLMRGLKKEMSEADMFRANAAFREIDGVPMDILTSCLYEEEMQCFSCPTLEELKKYKVILSTFMSSYRLYGEGIMAGHFSHIFLVDASSATEPETMIPLANFANDSTIVVVTGAPGNHSGWIRSKIAREKGLMTSYFERLCDSGMHVQAT